MKSNTLDLEPIKGGKFIIYPLPDNTMKFLIISADNEKISILLFCIFDFILCNSSKNIIK